MELQSNLGALKKAGITPVAISYDSEKVLARFAKEKRISFPLLSDPGSKTISAFKVLHTGMRRGRLKGVPHPGTFIIGQDGKIVAKLAHDGYRKRHTSVEIIEAVGT